MRDANIRTEQNLLRMTSLKSLITVGDKIIRLNISGLTNAMKSAFIFIILEYKNR